MQKATIDSLRSHISEPRFGRYLAEAGGDPRLALELYQWNIRASAAVVSSTGMVEVQLRNSLDQALRSWNSAQTDPTTHARYGTDWLQRPASPLRDVINPKGEKEMWVRAHRSLLGIDGKPSKLNPSHDDLIAGLTFGTWRFLLPSPKAKSKKNDRIRIWNEALCFPFKERTASSQQLVSRNVVYGWVNCLWYYRNRASHLEPFLEHAELKRIHRTSARLLNSLNPDAASWFAGQQFLPEVANQHPLNSVNSLA